MNLENQKKLYVSFVIIGVIIFLIFVLSGDDGYSGGLLCGMGSALAVIGILRLIRLHRLGKDPDRAADYEASLKDERIIYIANKARAMTFLISIYVQLAVGLIAQFAFGQRLLNMVLCYMVCFQSLLFTVLYRYYNKKY